MPCLFITTRLFVPLLNIPLIVLISMGVEPIDEADIEAEAMDIGAVWGLLVVEFVLFSLGGPMVDGVAEYP